MKRAKQTFEPEFTEQMRAIMRRVWWSKVRRVATWFWLAIMLSSFVAGGVCTAVTRDGYYLLFGLALAVLLFVVGGVLLAMKYFNPLVKVDSEKWAYDSKLCERWFMVVTLGSIFSLLSGTMGASLLYSLACVRSEIFQFPREMVIVWMVMFSVSWSIFCFGLFAIRQAQLGFPAPME